MAEFGFRMLLNIFLQLLPESLIIPDLLARGADWNEALEDFDFAQRSLKVIVTPDAGPAHALCDSPFPSSVSGQTPPGQAVQRD